MRTTAAVALLLLAACGSSPTATTQSSSAPSKRQVLFAVLSARGLSIAPNANDTVAIFGLDGHLRARATFMPRRVPNVGPAPPYLQPEARVAAGRVFYIDGAGVVRALDAGGGSPQVVATFPITQAQEEVSFAVSPDGARLIASTLVLPAVGAPSRPGGPPSLQQGPLHVTLDEAPAGGVTRRLRSVDIPVPTELAPTALQVVGWDSVAPIAVPDQPTGTPNGVLGALGYGGESDQPVGSANAALGPLGYGNAARLDARGVPGPFLGGADCTAGSEVADGTVVCVGVQLASGGVGTQVRRADGTVLFGVSSGVCRGDAVLAPDAAHVACDTVVASAGGAVVILPRGFTAQGWLDDGTVIGIGARNDMAYVRLSAPDHAVDLGFQGRFAGVVQPAAP